MMRLLHRAGSPHRETVRGAAHDMDPFGTELPSVLALVAWHQPAGRGDDPPPGKVRPRASEQRTHSPCRSRKARLSRHLAVRHDLARLQSRQHTPDFQGETSLRVAPPSGVAARGWCFPPPGESRDHVSILARGRGRSFGKCLLPGTNLGGPPIVVPVFHDHWTVVYP
jgi:hypothetical protein